MSRPGGLQLSPTQIVASLLATLTGAFLASYLGVGGTLAGAAVGSIASTTGTEVYRHYLRRSQERLKAAGEVLRHRQTGQHARQPASVGRAGGLRPDTSADATETQIIPAATSTWHPQLRAEPNGHTAAERATGELGDGAGNGDGAAPGAASAGPWWLSLTRRQWLTYGGVALGLFLAVMVVVTIIELSVGKPLDAAVWGKHSTGTSVGSLVGGSGPHKQPASPHGSSPTPATQSTGSAGPSSSPATTPSGTAPTPSMPASSGASSGPAATPTPGSGQGSAQAVTPTP
jgi:hypothetical protein